MRVISLCSSVLAVTATDLAPYPGYTGSLKVTGKVYGWKNSWNDEAAIYYDIAGLEAECATAPEGVGNACGIHIHEGKTCDDAAAVGGHYYNKDSITDDPWSPVTYSSRKDGRSSGQVSTKIGEGQDVHGRAIVVHDQTGGRVACALIKGKLETVAATGLVPYPGYSGPLKVTGKVGGVLFGSDAFLWYSLSGLEAECAKAPEGVANACGIHIHEGMTCDDADAVGGHYYDADSITDDPWKPLTYTAGTHGFSFGNVKATIGKGQNINGRAIVVHDQTGGRVACALVKGWPATEVDAIAV